MPVVPVLAVRHALTELRVTTAWGVRRALCYDCLRKSASNVTLGGHDGIAPRRKVLFKRPLQMQKPYSGFARAMATVSHCRTA